MPSFPLDRSDWIPVALCGGGQDEVSLLEAIETAKDVRRIVGNPLEVAVLMRLLLAIAHCVRAPENSYEWLDVWEDRAGLLQDMARYVRDHAASFDLYSAERPYGQHPGLALPSATPATLVYDRAQGNNPVFLDASQVAAPRSLSSAEAARALLVTHAFAGSGTGGNNPLNGGKKDTMYAGPLCARMVGFLEGDNLAKTIALNLASGRKAGRPGWDQPLADTPGQKSFVGLADLYTRATRSARLRPSEDGERCLAASLYMGQAVPADETDKQDPTLPRYVAQDKKIKAFRLSPDRAAWRSAHLLLAAHPKDEAGPLRAIEQLEPLVSSDQFPRDESIALRLLGVAANAQGPVTELWRDETLRFDLSIVADDARYEAMRGAIEAADGAASRLRGRLFGFAKAYLAGADGNPDPKDVGRLSDELAPDMADYWSMVGPEGERIALDGFAPVAWQKTLQVASESAFRRAVDRLPADARRFRAQFAREEKIDDKAKKGKGKP